MHAERLILETDQSGCLKDAHNLPPNTQLEIILLKDETGYKAVSKHRSPHPDIKGKIDIYGDIISSVPETAWDLFK